MQQSMLQSMLQSNTNASVKHNTKTQCLDININIFNTNNINRNINKISIDTEHAMPLEKQILRACYRAGLERSSMAQYRARQLACVLRNSWVSSQRCRVRLLRRTRWPLCSRCHQGSFKVDLPKSRSPLKVDAIWVMPEQNGHPFWCEGSP